MLGAVSKWGAFLPPGHRRSEKAALKAAAWQVSSAFRAQVAISGSHLETLFRSQSIDSAHVECSGPCPSGGHFFHLDFYQCHFIVSFAGTGPSEPSHRAWRSPDSDATDTGTFGGSGDTPLSRRFPRLRRRKLPYQLVKRYFEKNAETLLDKEL